MRQWPALAVAIALVAIAPQAVMAIGASTVSVLLESLPYLAVATALSPFVGRYAHALVAYAGCGCGAGPSARSIPAAVAAGTVFGAPIAVARVLVASLAARIVPVREHMHSNLLGELVHLVPAALLAAEMMQIVPMLPLHGLHPAALWLAGALLGLVASPCALGGVALAASLRASAPLAALGILCTAGVIPTRLRFHSDKEPHDSLAYLLVAIACGLIAARHGGTFVHPRMTLPLVLCAVYCAVMAVRFRAAAARSTPRLAAAVALAVVVIGAPQPIYHASETTLADAFAGERVDFTGVAVTDRARSALVRYAITCCRADAAPVSLVVDRDLSHLSGHWMQARGTIENDDGALRLHVAELTPIAPPLDPFAYR